MSEFKRWISYLYSYRGEIKGKNVGFAKIDVRDGRCRFQIGLKGVYGCDEKGLDVGLFVRQENRPVRISVGKMRIMAGSGEFCASTGEDNLFETGIRLSETGGLWLTGSGRNVFYLTSWEKSCLDIRDFLPRPPVMAASEPVPVQKSSPSYISVSAAAVEEQEPVKNTDSPAPCLEELREPGLWESLCRYYPKTEPELRKKGVELLQIRPADIRYLPRSLWHFGSNSFLLHGYYNYKHLVLGRIGADEKKDYILGVRGIRDARENFSAGLFGFHSFLPTEEEGREGYWYTQITL